jgi:hypothetical protein
MTQTIDLKIFCSSESDRLGKPFSIGEFTYATNGHLAIRIPRDASVEEIEYPPAIENQFLKFRQKAPMRPLKNPIPEEPKPQQIKYDTCEGTGKEHDCPHCKCGCEECDGSGWMQEFICESVQIGPRLLSVAAMRKIATLPQLMVDADSPGEMEAMSFKFDGGDGLLMPLRCTYERHLDVEL